MTFVLNRGWGGFCLPVNFVEEHGLAGVYDFDPDLIHINPDLIDWVRHADKHARGNLEVVEIPDTATDYELDECDGWESITYVVNGTIFHA